MKQKKKKKKKIMSRANLYLCNFTSRFMSSQCTKEQYYSSSVKCSILVLHFSSSIFFPLLFCGSLIRNAECYNKFIEIVRNVIIKCGSALNTTEKRRRENVENYETRLNSGACFCDQKKSKSMRYFLVIFEYS